MNCKQVQELLSAYQAGSLNPELHSRIDQHIEQCEKCRKIFEGETSVSIFLHSEDDVSLPGNIARDVMQRVAQIEHTRESNRYRRLYHLSAKMKWLFGILMMITFILIGILVYVFNSANIRYYKSYGDVGYTWIFSKDHQEQYLPAIDDTTELQGVIGWGGAMGVVAGSQLEQKKNENEEDGRIIHTYDFTSSDNFDKNEKNNTNEYVKEENENESSK